MTKSRGVREGRRPLRVSNLKKALRRAERDGYGVKDVARFAKVLCGVDISPRRILQLCEPAQVTSPRVINALARALCVDDGYLDSLATAKHDVDHRDRQIGELYWTRLGRLPSQLAGVMQQEDSALSRDYLRAYEYIGHMLRGEARYHGPNGVFAAQFFSLDMWRGALVGWREAAPTVDERRMAIKHLMGLLSLANPHRKRFNDPPLSHSIDDLPSRVQLLADALDNPTARER
jgi:hypothetical protein